MKPINEDVVNTTDVIVPNADIESTEIANEMIRKDHQIFTGYDKYISELTDSETGEVANFYNATEIIKDFNDTHKTSRKEVVTWNWKKRGKNNIVINDSNCFTQKNKGVRYRQTMIRDTLLLNLTQWLETKIPEALVKEAEKPSTISNDVITFNGEIIPSPEPLDIVEPEMVLPSNDNLPSVYRNRSAIVLANGDEIIVNETEPCAPMSSIFVNLGYGDKSKEALIGMGVIELIQGEYSNEHYKPTADYEKYFIRKSISSYQLLSSMSKEFHDLVREDLKEYIVKTSNRKYYYELVDDALDYGVGSDADLIRFINDRGGKVA